MSRIPLFLIASWLTILFPVLLMTGSALADTAMCIIGVLFLIHSWQTRNWGWTRANWLHCLMLLWAYMLARSIFTQVPEEAFHRSLPFLRYFIFSAALAFWTLQDSVTRQRFLWVLTSTIVFLVFDGLVQRITFHDLFLHAPVIQPDGNLRLTGPFRSAVLGIMLTWLSFPATLWLLTEPKVQPYMKLLIIGLCLLILAVIALSGERMALLLALLGWGIAFVLMSGYRRILFAVMATGVAVVVGLALMLPSLSARQGESTVHTLTNWKESPYGLLLSSDLAVAALNPIFGVGPNHFRIVCPTLYPDMIGKPETKEKLDSLCNIHPHNIYMEWFIETGIIGFVLFLGFIAMIVRQCWKMWPTARLHPVFIGALIAVFVRLWPIAPSTGFFSRWGAPPFWLMLGLLLVYLVPQPTKINEE